MEKIKLPSGAVLDISLLSFEQAWDVSRIVVKEFEKLEIDLNGIDFKSIRDNSSLALMDIVAFKGPLCSVLSSKALVDAAKMCFPKCTYNGLKIVLDETFAKKETRADFLPVVFHVLKANISPFFDNLLLFLSKN